MDDKTIVALYFSRNDAALSESEKKYGRYCRYISERILRNRQDAEECVNEALHAAWKSIPPQNPSNLKTYLGKLTREISVSRFRKEHAEKRFPGEYLMSLEEIEEAVSDSSFVSGIEKTELAKKISDFLRSVSETERNLFIRRYWFDDSIQEICERYHFGESKVKTTLKRTRDKLSEYLRKEGYIT